MPPDEPSVSKPIADFGDNLADAIMAMIDQEPPEVANVLLHRLKARTYVIERHPGDPSMEADAGHVLVRFGELREYAIPLVRISAPRRRFDA